MFAEDRIGDYIKHQLQFNKLLCINLKEINKNHQTKLINN